MDKSTIDDKVKRAAKLLQIEEYLERKPKALSGGQRQRVAIARSLVHKPKVLVADEPTGNLDSINTREIIDLLKKINNFGTTVVLVTHDKDVVNSLKSRVISLEDGYVISDQSMGRYLV